MIWVEERENIFNYIKQAGFAVLTLNIVMMVLAYYIAKLLTTGIKQRKCISIERGLQNGTLAIAVAGMIFGNAEAAKIYLVPTAVYALIMYLTGFILIFILRRSN